jgi:hypothetical protein
VLPVILHLWNDRRGKVLRIGSIQLLASASRRMAWSRRLSQRWLLLLRCLLLLALAFLLAGPYWRKGGTAGAGKGWVLEDGVGDGAGAGGGGDAVGAGAGSRAAYRLLIDSLLKAGYERHVLDDSVNYWNGFRRADQAAPEGLPFYIFTTGLAQRFSGERPVTEREVHWYTYAALDTVAHWIQRAWKVGRDSVRLLAGTSQPTGSFYRVESFAAGGAGVTGGTEVTGVTGVTDTSVLRVTIYTEPVYRQDGRYVAAAVRALEEFTRRRIEVVVTERVPAAAVPGAGVAAGPGAAGWLFWLALRPVPAGLGYAHVLSYESGKTVDVDSWVEGVELMKEVQGTGIGLTAVWADGYGRTILGKEIGGRYHLFTRFDPDWSGLSWSRSFPVLLASLLFSGDAPGPAMMADRRVLDPEQIAPVRGNAGAERQAAALRTLTARVKTNDRAEMTVPARGEMTVAPRGEMMMPPLGATDLAPAAWLLITLLFILERVISYGKTKT